WIYSGQQDSGTVGIASRSDYGQLTFRDWHPVGGDERDYDLPSPRDPEIIFASGLGGRLSRWDGHTGQVTTVSPWPVSSYGADPRKVKYRSTWIQPIAIAGRDPFTLYAAAQVVFRSTDEGKSWQTISPDLTGADPKAKDCIGDVPIARARACGYGVISTLAPSPRAAEQLWVGTESGIVQLTRDGGKSWQDVTPKGLADWSRLAQVEASPGDAATAYLAVDRHRMDDPRPYVYRTHDFGGTWTLAVSGLPDHGSVYVVRQDPVEPRLLYAGTTRGAFVSFDDGDHWQPLQLDLPTSGINDLTVHGSDLIAATQGRGLWVLDDVTPLRWLATHEAATVATLVPPAVAIRWPGNQNRDTPLPPEEPRTPNPPAGAVLDYVLPAAARLVTLDVVDSAGKVVHHESSAEAPPRVEAEQYFADRWLKAPQPLPSAAGHHRVVWTLRLPRPPAIAYEYSIAAVPDADTPALPQGLVALPGSYTVRLTVDGVATTAALQVAMDPRVKTPLADLQAQLALAEELRGTLAAAVALHEEVEAMGKRLASPPAPQEKQGKAAESALTEQKAALERFRSADDPEDIAGTLSSLATDVESADAAPTQSQRDVLAEYAKRLAAAQAHWQALLGKELAGVGGTR
ncbi:MAG TPA: sialidase family protein, partial [Thermoanaerobaculia bacterium]|nr:sialidase family protein [Thermoanaerobaculia bacterium]